MILGLTWQEMELGMELVSGLWHGRRWCWQGELWAGMASASCAPVILGPALRNKTSFAVTTCATVNRLKGSVLEGFSSSGNALIKVCARSVRSLRRTVSSFAAASFSSFFFLKLFD